MGKIIKYSFKTLFYLFIIAVNAIILWRLFFSGDPKSMKVLSVNENTLAAYEEHGSDMLLLGQKQRTITSSGLFSVTDAVFIPQAEQIQIVVRYNNSTLRHTAEDFSLDEVPSKKDDVFDVTIVKTIDLTPETDEDNTDEDKLGEERYYPSEVKTEYKTLYTYKRYIFDGVTNDDAVGMFVDIYYNGAIDYDAEPYGALCIYDGADEMQTDKLGRDDIRAIEKAKK